MGNPFSEWCAKHYGRPDPRDVEIATLRAEVARLTADLATAREDGARADQWSYCPFCGIVAPRPGLHRDGCPGQEMQRRARDHKPLEKP